MLEVRLIGTFVSRDNMSQPAVILQMQLILAQELVIAEARKQLAIGLEVLLKTAPEADIYIAYYGLGELARLEGRYSEAIELYRARLKRSVH